MTPAPKRRGKGPGFRRAATLVSRDIRAAGEARGFAVSRLLTHWAEVAGAAMAARTRPVKVSYPRDGMGATLTLLVSGAEAPMVQMEAERLRERVNACYGYNAISRIRLTQTAATGFAEPAAGFAPAPPSQPVPDPETRARATRAAEAVGDADLRAALEKLGTNILSRTS